ncbi:MAG TPA: hypothetical protein VKP65_04010, partial [Rhodothermales bacterium]|nr:hypothetical protein [Rhodothermales bacterium]
MSEVEQYLSIDDLHEPTPRGMLLSNGQYTTFLTAAGSGYSSFGNLALTRWLADRTRDADGFFIYLRDLDSRAFWSAGYQPIGGSPERYEVRFRPGVAEITREDGGIETTVTVCVAPEADLEIRRIQLTNLSDEPRRLELTSYAEAVLNTPGGDASHPAFSKLFVQTERVPDRPVLLARRRPRSPDDELLWLAHHLIGAGSDVQLETDRARFIGRGRTLEAPQALVSEALLSGTLGNVLDPLVSLRCVVELAPGETAERTFTLGAAPHRDAVIDLTETTSDAETIQHIIDAAEQAAKDQAANLNLSLEEAQQAQWLTGALLYGHPGLRTAKETLRAVEAPHSAFNRYGLGSTTPLVVSLLSDDASLDALCQLVKMHAFWQEHGLTVHVGVLAESDAMYTQAEEVLTEKDADLHLLREDELASEERTLLLAAARFVVQETLPDVSPASSPVVAKQMYHPPATSEGSVDLSETLQLDNGFGGFSEAGDEYVIHVAPTDDGLRRPPLPWTNVVANERAGFLATESGGGYTWCGNSREHCLTPWLNDPVSDPVGEALYLRDEEAGVFWSPTPAPVPQDASYEVRHGFGYTRYRHTSQGLEQEVTQFVPRHDPVKIIILRITNRSERTRHVSAFRYQRWVLGSLPAQSPRFVMTEYDEDTQSVLARNPTDQDFGEAVAFASAVGASVAGFTADRTAFLGRHGALSHPAALASGAPLDGQTGAGFDPCAALQVNLQIEPGATVKCAFLLGEGADRKEAIALLRKYDALAMVYASFDEVYDFWKETCATVQVETPGPELDLMVNGWLLYQNLSCRMWGRSAYYQSGGAFGFRDQLQDSSALIYALPERTRAQILLHAAHQFVEGDVLHWWHPPASRGIRTRFSDDLLWLPYITAFYLKTTGDHAVLDESVRFLEAEPLEEGEDEVFLEPQDSGEQGSLYEHCCRALDRSLTQGTHGLPLMGTGDWNDGMNRVGRLGRGESVWLGFFIYCILHDFIPICKARGDDERVASYTAYRQHLAETLNDTGWDGNWYRRAYYDNGAPLGSAQSDECQIDALAQAWAVISDAAPSDRAEQALDAMVEHLVSEEEGLIRLLTPAFDETSHDPGYIKGYVPGVRENGGQYTHAALWAVKALAEAGRNDQATRLIKMLSPASHARTPEEV